MVKWLGRKLTIYKWQRLKRSIAKQKELYSKVMLLYTKFPVDLKNCTFHHTHNVYISINIQTLESLLLNLERSKEEFIATNYFSTMGDAYPVSNIRFNIWATFSRGSPYEDIRIATIHSLIGKCIADVYNHSVLIDRVNYAERRLSPILKSYLTLTTVLGDMYE